MDYRKVLAVIEYYLPGYKAGGPVKTLSSVVDRLGDEYLFQILTSDRDLGDRQSYSDVEPGRWHTVGKARVMYLRGRQRSMVAWHRLLRDIDFDVMYLNSFFSKFTVWTLVLRRLRLIRPTPVILAPRGEFARAALALKAYKKRPYLWLAKKFGLMSGVVWQASGEHEAEAISEVMGGLVTRPTPPVIIAADLTAQWIEAEPLSQPPSKHPGQLRVAFLGRVARMKNLDYAIDRLQDIHGDVIYDIYGPLEDAVYWHECQAQLARQRPGARITHCGIVAPTDVSKILANYHILFLPTRGENFGHAIYEALAAGCPVLISDQTPWRNLETAWAGWDVPLTDPERFRTILDYCVQMDDAEFRVWSHGARAYAQRFTEQQVAQILPAYRRLFSSQTDKLAGQ